MTRQFLFDGLVQNVHFRKSVLEFASRFNCVATATNLSDYTVLVSITGDFNAIDEAIHATAYSFERSNARIVAYRELPLAAMS